VSRPAPTQKKQAAKPVQAKAASRNILPGDYFRIRDFEYVQPLYDLAFLLEVGALAKAQEVPKYRTFSLWRAGFSLDGYGTTIDRWLDGTATDEDLDYVPSLRIREYLKKIKKTGTIPELSSYRSARFARCLRLRSVRGLGPSQIALTVSSNSLREEWLNHVAKNLSPERERITELYNGSNWGPWQSAHLVPPLLRFLHAVEAATGKSCSWGISGVADPFEPVTTTVTVSANADLKSMATGIAEALKQERHFRRGSQLNGEGVKIKHQMGWSFVIKPKQGKTVTQSIADLVKSLDPLGATSRIDLVSDLHLHTAWSDGSASVNSMAGAVVASGLKFFAVTDHSRSSKLQGGLTPPLWLRQANALSLATRWANQQDVAECFSS
jgi:hypothetical protein